MRRVPSDVQFRLQVADSFELDFIANRYCDPPLYREQEECDILFRQRIVESWEKGERNETLLQ